MSEPAYVIFVMTVILLAMGFIAWLGSVNEDL